MDELKEIIAKNLTELRTCAHLTQLQLAEMLNYSDKAVSKWERARKPNPNSTSGKNVCL